MFDLEPLNEQEQHIVTEFPGTGTDTEAAASDSGTVRARGRGPVEVVTPLFRNSLKEVPVTGLETKVVAVTQEIWNGDAS